MAGDWIKFRVKLITDGRVRAMARATKQKPATILGGLMIVWAVADEHATDDGTLEGYSADDIDEITGVKGFSIAMPSDWIEILPKGIRLPNYLQHNGLTAKKRAETNRRVANFRNANVTQPALQNERICNADVTQEAYNGVTKSVTREEKRREEKRIPETKDIADPPGESAQAGSNLADVPGAKTKAKTRERNPLFDAVIEVTKRDPKLNGPEVGAVAADLAKAEPPYTPDEVREFGRRFIELCPYAEGRTHPLPSPGELKKNIALVRTAPAKTSPRRPPGRDPQADRMQRHIDALLEPGPLYETHETPQNTEKNQCPKIEG